jgi:hypothetical protein
MISVSPVKVHMLCQMNPMNFNIGGLRKRLGDKELPPLSRLLELAWRKQLVYILQFVGD